MKKLKLNINKINRRLKELGWSRSELARRCGMTPQAVAWIMREKTTRLKTIDLFARALGERDSKDLLH